jgi:putative SOS response-associated peptidase YedK
MCGRYRLHRAPHALAEWAELKINPFRNWQPRFNIAPTHDAAVIRRHPKTAERQVDFLRWGLVPPWAKDASGEPRRINARSETVATTPAFRDSFAKRRCLIPADGFYEWAGEMAPKQPWTVALASGEPMMFSWPMDGLARARRGRAADLHDLHHGRQRSAAPPAPPHAGDPAARGMAAVVGRSAGRSGWAASAVGPMPG